MFTTMCYIEDCNENKNVRLRRKLASNPYYIQHVNAALVEHMVEYQYHTNIVGDKSIVKVTITTQVNGVWVSSVSAGVGTVEYWRILEIIENASKQETLCVMHTAYAPENTFWLSYIL